MIKTKQFNSWFTLISICIVFTSLPIAFSDGVLRTYNPDDLPPTTLVAHGQYFVQFSQPAVIASKNGRCTESAHNLQSNIRTEHRTFTHFIETQPHKFDNVKVDHTFAYAFNGVSLSATPDQINELMKAPGVKTIYPILLHSFDPVEITPHFNRNIGEDFSSSHILTDLTLMRQEFNLTGRGIRVAIIDSGLDYRHPAFSRPGMKCNNLGDPGCRVVGGLDIVGDQWDPAWTRLDQLQPKPDFQECFRGHGTHVAGIIGGSDVTFTGVAPEVDLIAYKVFSCNGEKYFTNSVAILKAIEHASRDNVDVINLSIGGGPSFNDFPTVQALNDLAKAGVIVVSSHGNNGYRGLFWGGSPGQTKDGFSVGSIEASTIVTTALSVNGVEGIHKIPYKVNPTSVNAHLLSQSPVKISPHPINLMKDGCFPYPQDMFRGRVALIGSRGCSFPTKMENAINAGAIAVLFSTGENIPISAALLDKTNKFVGFLPKVDGEKLWMAIHNGANVTVSDNKDHISVPNLINGGDLSHFSSWGPSPTLEIKPDIMAPGGNIWSSYPIHQNSYASMSGTSMSAPYMAGVAALFLQYKTEKGRHLFEDLQRRALNTARPIMNINDPKFPWSVARQGAGLINVYDIFRTKVSVTPSKLQLGDGYARKSTSLYLYNEMSRDIIYQVSHLAAPSVWQKDKLKMDEDPISTSSVAAHVHISTTTITVPANRRVTIQVNITPSRELNDHWIQSGWIVFTPKEDEEASPNNSITLRVPYLLMTGTYETYPISHIHLQAFVHGSDQLESETSKEIGPFSLNGGDVPSVNFATVHVIRALRLILLDAHSNNRMGIIQEKMFVLPGMHVLPSNDTEHSTLIRNLYPDEVNQVKHGWSGEYVESIGKDVPKKSVLDGEYRIVIEMVPPSQSNDNWENRFIPYWTSPKIIIRRS